MLFFSIKALAGLFMKDFDSLKLHIELNKLYKYLVNSRKDNDH